MRGLKKQYAGLSKTSGIMDRQKDLKELERLAKEVRRLVLAMLHKRGASHIGSSFSAVDIMVALYFSAMDVSPHDISNKKDRFILSKGHAAPALYAVLALRGFFPVSVLDTFCVNGGKLGVHPQVGAVPGVEVATGSLGHGLAIGEGMAIAMKADGKTGRVFALLGDGECDEGTVWEAAMSSAHLRLDNLVAIVDYNKIQAFGNVKEVLGLEPFADKWRSFGWDVREADGHSMKDIVEAVSNAPFTKGRPSVIIAHTIKGKGVSFMENQLMWHYKSPDKAQFEAAMKELEK